MVQTIFFVRLAASDEAFTSLARFFADLGLEPAEDWQGRQDRGLLFRTPQAGIEIGMGGEFPPTDLVVQVANADSAYDIIRARGYRIASEIADQSFGGRMFLVEPAPGQRIAVFSWRAEKQPQPVRTLEGAMDATGMRFGLVVSRFNSFITERLLAGALDALRRSGARDAELTIVRVPGAFEIPAAARALAESGRVDAVICLGCLIRGETTHYEHIATECTRGIGQSAQETGIPHAYGVLTCENLEQAIDRAGLKAGNKGFEAAMAAIEMASLKKQVAAEKR